MQGSVDILVITAHPDDAEIGMGGTILRHITQGRSVGLVELTGGELGTRGTAEIRAQEAAAATKVLGVSFRYQLGLRDGFFRADESSLLKVITALRTHRPNVVLTNAVRDRHPDHGRGAALVAEACFLSGLRRIGTEENGTAQEAWRPKTVLHAIQDNWIDPDLVVDITPYWDKKLEALLCFKSQFHDPKSKEPISPISVPEFLPSLQGRALAMGRLIGSTYGEGYTVVRPPAVGDLLELG
ncbi:MAG: bacillithiol biosynthesis deacetylase BshB1 [Flavobacteriales bacterium]